MENILKYIIIFVVSIILIVLGINTFVIVSTRKNIITEDEAKKLEKVDCIVVLGCRNKRR